MIGGAPGNGLRRGQRFIDAFTARCSGQDPDLIGFTPFVQFLGAGGDGSRQQFGRTRVGEAAEGDGRAMRDAGRGFLRGKVREHSDS